MDPVGACHLLDVCADVMYVDPTGRNECLPVMHTFQVHPWAVSPTPIYLRMLCLELGMISGFAKGIGCITVGICPRYPRCFLGYSVNYYGNSQRQHRQNMQSVTNSCVCAEILTFLLKSQAVMFELL